jgi:hypothetical protein
MHFKERGDEEFTSPKRNDLFYVLKHRAFKLTNQNLPIFGVGSQNLKAFITSERD